MKTFLILYCAFAYGFEFSSMLDFIFDENVHNKMKDECPYPLPYIISFFLFLIAPLMLVFRVIAGIFLVQKDK